MSGFGAWAAGAGGTGVLLLCLFTLGLILGELDGGRRGRRAELEDQERAEAMARRTHPVYRERPPDFDAIRAAGRRAWAIQQERAEEEEWGPVHVGQALALTRDDLTDSAYTQDMAARMDRFLEGLFAVPYSADELWNGQ